MYVIPSSEVPFWAIEKNFIPQKNEDISAYTERVENLRASYHVDRKTRGRLVFVARKLRPDVSVENGIAFWEYNYLDHSTRIIIEQSLREKLDELINKESDEYDETKLERNKRLGLARWIFSEDARKKEVCPVCKSYEVESNQRHRGMMRVLSPSGVWDFGSKFMLYKTGFVESGGMLTDCVCR